MNDYLVIFLAIIDIFLLYSGIELIGTYTKWLNEKAAIFIFLWVLVQPMYWVAFILIFDKRGL